MKQYLDLLKKIITDEDSALKPNGRNGLTISRFGDQMRFNLQEGFPAVTTKKLHFKSVIHENIWFLSGSSNIKYLKDNDVRIWNEWADENGELGRVYGVQWTDWKTFNGKSTNQIEETIKNLTKNEYSRRHIVTAWNPGEIDQMALPPCHMFYQFNVREKKGQKFLDMSMYQRSADIFLGVPFNIAGYAILLKMFAQVVDLKPGNLIHSLGDHHIYLLGGENREKFYLNRFDELQDAVKKANDPKVYLEIKEWLEKEAPSENKQDHMPMVLEQLAREPRELPQLYINPNVKKINEFKYEDFEIKNYNPHPTIIGKVAQ